MPYYLCARETSPSALDVLNVVLSILAGQILRKKQHLVPFVYETYVKTAEQLSLKLPTLLRQLLSCLPTTFLIIDGLDECDPEAQNRLYSKLEWIASNRRNESPIDPEVRILICSQDAKGVPLKLQKQAFFSLSDEHASVARDVKVYTTNKVASLADRFSEDTVENIASTIVAKANGMFLWAKLVLQTVLEQESLLEIQDTLYSLPSGLTGVYLMLLNRMKKLAQDQQKPRIRMIFYWLLFAHRPMKAWEICDALVIGGFNLVLVKNYTTLLPSIVDICKPLIEVLPDQTVSLVHFSVKDFLLGDGSGPFIRQEDALTHINSACLKYLFTCEDFFMSKESAKTYHEIIMMMHGLFLYVVEAWKTHFANLASVSTRGLQHNKLLSSLIDGDVGSNSTSSPLQARQQNAWLSSRPQPDQVTMSSQVVKTGILESLQEAERDTSDGKAPFSVQPDMVRKAFTCFQRQFEKILNDECPYRPDDMDVSAVDLDQFRHRHAAAAFMCRWNQCLRSTSGFSSVEERNRHEQSHRKQFCCPNSDCDFARSGFTSRAALKNHIRRYHLVQEDMVVPELKIHKRRFDIQMQYIAFNCCRCGEMTYATNQHDRCKFEACLHEFCPYCVIAQPPQQVRLQRTFIDPRQVFISHTSTERTAASTPVDEFPHQSSANSQATRIDSLLTDSIFNYLVGDDGADNTDDGNAGRGDVPFEVEYGSGMSRPPIRFQKRRRSSIPITDTDKVTDQLPSAPPSRITSYWSAAEIATFPQLVPHYGRDYIKIAESLKTKTPAMVEHYYSELESKSPALIDYNVQLYLLEVQNMKRLGKPGLPPLPPPIVHVFPEADPTSMRAFTAGNGSNSNIENARRVSPAENSSSQRQASSFATEEPHMTTVSNLTGENALDEEYRIKCICGFDDDDGNTVYCEQCDTWQHISCFYHRKSVPDIHLCMDCAPKTTYADIDPRKARERQLRFRERLQPGRTKGHATPGFSGTHSLADTNVSRAIPDTNTKSGVVDAMFEHFHDVQRPEGPQPNHTGLGFLFKNRPLTSRLD